MITEARDYVIGILGLDEPVTDSTPLWPVLSQAPMDLALRIEQRFRIRLSDEDLDRMGSLTLGEFVALASDRIERTRATQREAAGSLPTREDVVSALAAVRGQNDAIEDIESMELLWLLNSMEQKYGISLEVGEAELSRMTTVDAAVDVLGRAIGATVAI